MTIATIFVHPMTLNSGSLIWLLIPLCVFVAVTYKTIRVRYLRRLGLQIVSLLGYMTAGLVALGVGLWIIQEIAL